VSGTAIRRLWLDDVAAFWALRLRALREHPGAFASSYEESSRAALAAGVLPLVRNC